MDTNPLTYTSNSHKELLHKMYMEQVNASVNETELKVLLLGSHNV
jgi:hypothetical protein